MIVGDFNSHSRFDGKQRPNHTTLHQRLRDDFGMVSAYHQAKERDGATGAEAPTYYHYWSQDNPFHLDYCFLPTLWVNRLGSVQVGGYDEWKHLSDHRPLVVEIKPAVG